MNEFPRSLRFCSIGLALLAVIAQGCDGGSYNVQDKACKKAVAGTYPEQSTSAYVLPYSIGETYLLAQGNCTVGSHRADAGQEFAYDFQMPIGTTLIASRGGVVVGIEESFSDGTGVPGEENFVAIRHDDGTIARYVHVTTLGALVELQDIVSQGDVVALSGNSGNSTGPHLHFDVVRDLADTQCLPNQTTCASVPINFINTRPHVNGLPGGRRYTAEQF